jgi:hypothetical protein
MMVVIWLPWIVIEGQKTIVLLEFIDTKYPKELREVFIDD